MVVLDSEKLADEKSAFFFYIINVVNNIPERKEKEREHTKAQPLQFFCPKHHQGAPNRKECKRFG